MLILVCSNGQSNLQDKQQPSKQATLSSSSANLKDREPATWRLEKIELEKQMKDWKKKFDDLQEATKKAAPGSVNAAKAQSDDVRATLDSVS